MLLIIASWLSFSLARGVGLWLELWWRSSLSVFKLENQPNLARTCVRGLLLKAQVRRSIEIKEEEDFIHHKRRVHFFFFFKYNCMSVCVFLCSDSFMLVSLSVLSGAVVLFVSSSLQWYFYVCFSPFPSSDVLCLFVSLFLQWQFMPVSFPFLLMTVLCLFVPLPRSNTTMSVCPAFLQ